MTSVTDNDFLLSTDILQIDMKKVLWIMLLAVVTRLDCMAQNSDNNQRAEVLIETTEGNIRIQLYNETPIHRDNFLKLTRLHFYDSLLIHRVIPNFMIQTGDPSSKHAEPGYTLGNTSLDYTLPAEIRLPQIYHKRGAVAMARESDDVNPEHRSSGSQFYIVQGKRHSSAVVEREQEYLDSLFGDSIKMTPQMIETYRKVGGTPHLDGTYTVFGEVIEGMDVVDKIEKADTDDYDRPVEDIRILKALITKDLPRQDKPANKAKPRRPTQSNRGRTR